MEQEHKGHRQRSAGAKYKKKQEKKQEKHLRRQGKEGEGKNGVEKPERGADGKLDLAAAKLRNPKAFTSASGRNAMKAETRRLEKEQRRLHVPLVDRTAGLEPPPILIAVVGPPKVRS